MDGALHFREPQGISENSLPLASASDRCANAANNKQIFYTSNKNNGISEDTFSKQNRVQTDHLY
jgi:hypothetical protein